MECSFPKCLRLAAPQLDQPICSHHAREVYLAVKDMLDGASVEQRVASAPSHGRGKPEQHRRERGLIYFMRIGENIKIGFTTNLRQRAADLGADAVLATIPGTRADEKRMHVRFGSSWLGGEWFHPDPELLAYADTLAHGG